MVLVASILPHAEFGQNDYREDSPHFIQWPGHKNRFKSDPPKKTSSVELIGTSSWVQVRQSRINADPLTPWAEIH